LSLKFNFFLIKSILERSNVQKSILERTIVQDYANVCERFANAANARERSVRRSFCAVTNGQNSIKISQKCTLRIYYKSH
jgi:hypothetical protein